MDDDSHASYPLEREVEWRELVQDVLETISMTERYLSANFVARILFFSLVYTSLQAYLEYRRINQISILSTASNFIAGITLALVLGLIFVQLPFSKGIRIGLAWLALFIVQSGTNPRRRFHIS